MVFSWRAVGTLFSKTERSIERSTNSFLLPDRDVKFEISRFAGLQVATEDIQDIRGDALKARGLTKEYQLSKAVFENWQPNCSLMPQATFYGTKDREHDQSLIPAAETEGLVNPWLLITAHFPSLAKLNLGKASPNPDRAEELSKFYPQISESRFIQATKSFETTYSISNIMYREASEISRKDAIFPMLMLLEDFNSQDLGIQKIAVVQSESDGVEFDPKFKKLVEWNPQSAFTCIGKSADTHEGVLTLMSGQHPTFNITKLPATLALKLYTSADPAELSTSPILYKINVI